MTSPKTLHPARTSRWGPWRLTAHPAREPNRLRILLLHGFASSPRELRPLGLALSRSGFSSCAPLLPGHGEGPKSMRSVVLADWLEAVQLTYHALRRDGSPVAVVGYCLGGVLALATARELNPRGLVLISTPTRALDSSLFTPTAKPDQRNTSAFLSACSSTKARAWRTAGAHPTVTDSFVERFQESIERATEDLSKVKSPVLLCRGLQDPLITSEQLQDLEGSLSMSSGVSVFESPEAGYAMPIDPGRSMLFSRVVSFLTEISALEERLLDGALDEI